MAIELKSVSKSYGQTVILQQINLRLPAKGIVGVSGPSGCGKTTLLHLLAGLQMPDHGIISDLSSSEVSMVFQEDRLLPWLSTGDNLNLIINDQVKTNLWLERMQLADKAAEFPEQLSGGMKRRIALARGLAYPSRLLLLDEPFKGLDLKLKRQLYPYLRQDAENRLVILVTHDPAELLECAQLIYLASGPPLQLQPIEPDVFARQLAQD